MQGGFPPGYTYMVVSSLAHFRPPFLMARLRQLKMADGSVLRTRLRTWLHIVWARNTGVSMVTARQGEHYGRAKLEVLRRSH